MAFAISVLVVRRFKQNKFKPGNSGNPETMFKPGNRHRWVPGLSGSRFTER